MKASAFLPSLIHGCTCQKATRDEGNVSTSKLSPLSLFTLKLFLLSVGGALHVLFQWLCNVRKKKLRESRGWGSASHAIPSLQIFPTQYYACV